MTLAAIVLLVGGVVLILAEFLLPGGILGVLGALMVVASTALGIYQFPHMALLIILGEVLAVVLALGIGFFNIAKGPWGKLLVNESEQRPEEGYINAVSPTHLIGQVATVITALRPSGTILISGERHDAVADGEFIDQGASVRIIEVHGNRIVVEHAETEPVADIPA